MGIELDIIEERERKNEREKEKCPVSENECRLEYEEQYLSE